MAPDCSPRSYRDPGETIRNTSRCRGRLRATTRQAPIKIKGVEVLRTKRSGFRLKAGALKTPQFAGDHTARDHPFPSRTRKLSLAGPMVLHGRLCGRLGYCRHYFKPKGQSIADWPFAVFDMFADCWIENCIRDAFSTVHLCRSRL